jgi:hypothetical protein
MIRKLTLLGAFVGLMAVGVQAQSCPPPTGINVSFTSGTPFDLATIDVLGPDSLWQRVELQVSALSDTTGSFKKARIPGSSIDVVINGRNLDPGTGYVIRARAACDITPPFLISPFFGLDTFTTPDTGALRLAAPVVDMDFFPNPVINTLNLNIHTDAQAPAQVQVMDLAGRTVAEQQFAAGVQQAQMDLSHLDNGSYFVRLRSGDAEAVESIQIAR